MNPFSPCKSKLPFGLSLTAYDLANDLRPFPPLADFNANPRLSLLLAESILRQHHFPPLNNDLPTIFRPTALERSLVLELGSGTGVLAVLLHRLVARWTASDQFDNLKLIQRNVRLNDIESGVGRVEVEEIDWIACEREMDANKVVSEADHYDLVLAVDCIYNEALSRPLARTLTRYTMPEKTACLVVAELRSSDVVSRRKAVRH